MSHAARGPSSMANDARKARRQRRLGPDAACVLCGEQTSESLTRSRQRVLERHHLGGVASDETLWVVVCLNCHARLSEGQRDRALDLLHARERSSLERLEQVLRGLALFADLLSGRLEEWALDLAAVVETLDQELPQWRQLDSRDEKA